MPDLRPVIVETVPPVPRTKQQRLVADWLWELIEPLLPPRPAPRGSGGRSRVDERAALEGILFVLHTGCRWRDLPPQLGYGSGHTAWWRLRAGQQAGVRDRLHQLVLGELAENQLIDWSRGCIDSASILQRRFIAHPSVATTMPCGPGDSGRTRSRAAEAGPQGHEGWAIRRELLELRTSSAATSHGHQ